MRLIDADELLEKKTVTVYSTNGAITDVVPVGEIRYFPTVDPVHAAGGCYCRECAKFSRYTQNNRNFGICQRHNSEVEENGFCSCGERREGVEDDELSI